MREAIAAWLAPPAAPGSEQQHANSQIDATGDSEATTADEAESRSENELRLNEEERKNLSPRVLAYIEYLERELSRKIT